MTDGPLSDKAAQWRQAIDAAVKAVSEKSGTQSNKWQDVEKVISNISSLPQSAVVVTYLSEPKHTKNRLRQRLGSHLRLLLAQDKNTLNSARLAIEADDGLGGVPVLLAEVTADGGARVLEVLIPRPPPAPAVSSLAAALQLPLTNAARPANEAKAQGGSALLAVTAGSPETLDSNLRFQDVVDRLRENGLRFPTDLVASFLLALQARRFVLLTGISGTGKTELALHVARAFSPSVEAPTSAAPDVDDNYSVVATARPYHFKHRRLILPVACRTMLPTLFADPNVRSLQVDLGDGVVEAVVVRRRHNQVEILLDAQRLLPTFRTRFKSGDPIRFSVRDDDVLVVAPAGDALPVVPSMPSYEVVAVRPDWTDNRGLLGFYNPLTNDYSSTPTLQLVLRAAEDAVQSKADGRQPRPFFIILDEMNLARAEHYFSDFLSAMESGEPIHLHDDDELAESIETPIPKRMTVPPNLFVVGTVNVDETTYMFSPKVLDRAFVLEFNDVDLDSLSSTAKSEPHPSPLPLTRMPGSLAILGRSSGDDWARFEALRGGELRAVLGELHEVLEQGNRHFGYRVAREIARFTILAADQTTGSDDALLAAFDVAVFSKVLPKLHGTQAELDAVLHELFRVAIGDAKADTNWTLQRGRLVGPDNLLPRLKLTASKLWRMRRQLRNQGFVSFIE